MGAGFSGEKIRSCDEATRTSSGAGLEDLPEDCIALILSRLNIAEICKLSRLNKTFLQASLSDLVWEPKLPENHTILAQKLFDESSERLVTFSKKEIYARLSRPILFEDATKGIWLDKSRGGVCVAISWKGLKITGIDDRRYWTAHISSHESRFGTIAYLHQTWWLEVEGSLNFEFPVGSYSVFFRLQLGRSANRLTSSSRRSSFNKVQNVHGWNIKPVQFRLATSNGNHAKSQYFLQEQGKWVDHHVGDFLVDNSDVPTQIKFSMAQIDCTHTKGGLYLDCVFISRGMESNANGIMM